MPKDDICVTLWDKLVIFPEDIFLEIWVDTNMSPEEYGYDDD